ncbi:translation initiation factor IF-2 isoform X2 [Girardinichthys multiradiatus]|uniref:translation initiation factor IF-2 isoform X2 n=1 Tax=Girardinichthys multiradiatus TaxID=208333 RepID=UPI001FAD7F04|nr:translation initiation factor IF-2 isoform X2 [Girardinichthys multiradiatus]
MMSYLWILLLGSLLASHTKALDDTQIEGTGETETDPVADGDADGATVTEVAHVESESETDNDPEPATDPELDADPEPAADPEMATDPETATDPEPAVVSEPTSEPDPVVDPEQTPETEQVADPEQTNAPELVVKPELGGEEPDISTAPAEIVEPVAPTEADQEPPTEVTEPVAPIEEDSGVATPAAGETVAPGVTPAVTAEIDAPATPQDADIEVPKQTTAAELEEATPAPTTPANGIKPEEDEEPSQKTIIEKIGRQFIPIVRGEDPNVNASADKDAQSGDGGSKPLAAILSSIIVSAVGAVTGYFAYQKRKLCFKKGQEADEEAQVNAVKVDKADAADAKSDPQESNTLLNSSQP